MSTVFDIDGRGWDARVDQARANPLDLSQQTGGAFDNAGKAIGMGVMRGGARVAQFIGMAAAAPAVLYAEQAGQPELLDPYFRKVDELANDAVDFWTPAPQETGVIGRVLGGLAEIALPLGATGGNPALLLGSQQMGTSVDLARQGVDAGTAVGVGGVQGVATAVGFRLPFLGKTLASRIGSGIGGNLATNMTAPAVSRGILESQGFDRAAESFNPFDLEARAVDVLTGAVFGGLAHLASPTQRAAAAGAANAKHFQLDTSPGAPADANALAAHQQALGQAIEQLMRGEPVSVPESVVEAGFQPRPREPAPQIPLELQALDEQRAPAWLATDTEIPKLDLPQQGVLRDIYTRATEIKPGFDRQVEALAQAIGGRAQLPGLKGTKRAVEKILADYGGQADKIKDVVRATIEVDTVEQAVAAVERIRAGFEVLPTGQRVLFDPSWTPLDGYRDAKLNVALANGVVAEIQVNMPGMLEAKSGPGHKLYEERRTIEAAAGSDPTPEQVARIAELNAQMRAIYSAAWDAAKGKSAAQAAGSSIDPLRLTEASGKGLSDPSSLTARTEAPPSAVGDTITGTPSTSQNPNPNPEGSLAGAGPDIVLPPGQSIPAQGAPAAAAQLNGRPIGAPTTVATTAGRRVQVQAKVVELSELLTSDRPGYPAELQPRQRDRAASQAQIQAIASDLNPELLGASPTADTGAPIVGPDAVVESGNGRVMALRKVYEAFPEKAAEYRAFLEAQGADLTGMREPVLVRERVSELDAEGRRAFTVEANQAAVMAMSSVERAGADARLLDEQLLSQIRGPDYGAASNVDFVRGFLARLPAGERNALVTADGRVSQEGIRRLQAAVMERAYGGTPEADAVLQRTLESTQSDVKSITGAMLEAAPDFAKLRQAIEDGKVPPETSIGAELAAAVEAVQKIRSEGRSVREYQAQSSMFEGARDARVKQIVGLFYDGQRAAGAPKIAERLRQYATQAASQRLDQGSLFDAAPVSPSDILAGLTRESSAPAPKQSGLFEVQAARQAVEARGDLAIPTGEIDADGRPIVRSAKEALAAAEAEVAKAENDSQGFGAAVACFLENGVN